MTKHEYVIQEIEQLGLGGTDNFTSFRKLTRISVSSPGGGNPFTIMFFDT